MKQKDIKILYILSITMQIEVFTFSRRKTFAYKALECSTYGILECQKQIKEEKMKFDNPKEQTWKINSK